MGCLIFHRWRPVRFDRSYGVDDAFGRTFGNGWLVEECTRCGKERRRARYLPDTQGDR